MCFKISSLKTYCSLRAHRHFTGGSKMVKLITPHPGKCTRIGPFIARDTSQNLEGSLLIYDFGDARFAVQDHDDLITPGPI